MALVADSDAGQASITAEQRRQAILRSWSDETRAPTPILPVDSAWKRTLPAAPAAAGAMDDTRIYVPLRDESFVALDRETGATVWTRQIQVTAVPTVGDGSVYVATTAAILGLDATDGSERWSAALDEAVTAPLTWDNGWVIGITQAGTVIAIRATDGVVVWRRPLGSTSRHPIVSSGDGLVYLALANSRLVALAIDTGEVVWQQPLEGTLSEPAAARDRVFVGSTDNFLYAFRRSGTFEWKWRNGGDVIGVATDGETIYIASLDNIIRALNRGNGNQRWKKPTGTRPTFPPRAFGGTVVLAGITPVVMSFVGTTGDTQGTIATGGELVGAPLIDTTPTPFAVALVTITREGVVDALRPRALTFREAAGLPMSSLPGHALGRDRLP